MSPRLKLRAATTPLVLAGALWGGSALLAAGHCGPAQTPPPCGPDGVCLPKADTYGVYATRWRKFPGDIVSRVPTEAEKGEAKPPEETLGGPQLPKPSEEGQIGPPRPERRGPGGAAPGTEPGPAPGAEQGGTEVPPGLPPLPGEEPPPGAVAPAPGPAAPAAPGEQPAPQTPPATEKAPAPATPEQNLLDPFGLAPPTPPAWLRSAAAAAAAEAKLQPLPMVEPAIAVAEPVEDSQMVQPAIETRASITESTPAAIESPNLEGDDAPPALPAALQGFTTSMARPVWTPGATAALPPVMQPESIRPLVDPHVAQASAEEPIQLINPAAVNAEEAGGIEQAIYFEASDLPAATPIK